jgi:hypothetical protein
VLPGFPRADTAMPATRGGPTHPHPFFRQMGILRCSTVFTRKTISSGALILSDLRCDTLISVDPPTVQSLLADLCNIVWQVLSVSSRTCPSRGAQLCTYLCWFARPSLLPPRVSVLRLHNGVRQLLIFLESCANAEPQICGSAWVVTASPLMAR